MRAISIRSRTARPDFKGPTLQAGFISCDRKAGFAFLHGKTRRPVPRRSRRNIPIPPAPGSGAGAIRRCGDITHGRQDATGFHKLVGFWKYASRIGIKKARDADTFRVEGIRKPNQKMHRALASPVRKDGTKQGLATFIPLIMKSS